MTGTKESWLKARETMVKKCGGEAGYRAHRHEMSAKGGRNGTGLTGFAMFSKDKLRAVSSKGGTKSRRKPKVV